jgi:hypothetical protein
MEVHSHTHTPRKKWTHYFWEFLMLFLAVFCGFLAEYQLEHKIEKDREKQFMKSLLEDLEKDSTSLSYNLREGPGIINYSDSLTNELTRKPLAGKEKRLYQFSSLLSEGVNFKYYDRTVSQLRNSGGFRLLTKLNVSNALIDYDVLMREAVNYASSIECWSFISPAIEKSALIFDIRLVFNIHDEARKFINNTDSIHFPYETKLLTYDEKVIKEFINLQRYAQLTDEVKLNYSEQAIKKNRLLDSLIRKEYHIKK